MGCFAAPGSYFRHGRHWLECLVLPNLFLLVSSDQLSVQLAQKLLIVVLLVRIANSSYEATGWTSLRVYIGLLRRSYCYLLAFLAGTLVLCVATGAIAMELFKGKLWYR